MKINCDVLVVGAGPAGLIASVLLSKKGFSVVILEKKKYVGSYSPKFDITEGNRIKSIIKELNIIPNKISSRSEWASQNNTFILDSEIQDFYFKRGNTSDSLENNLFLKLQEKLDLVTFLFDSEIVSIKNSGTDIRKINTKKYSISPKHVVFANGKDLSIDQKLDLHSKVLASFKGFGAIFTSPKTNLIPYAKIFFDWINAPGGYIYSGSVCQETFACIVIDDLFSEQVDLEKNLSVFIKKNFDNVHITNYFNGKGFCGLKDVLKGNVCCIGGNALFHDPFLGYGLNYAIESAYYAAQSIIKGEKQIYQSYSTKIQDEIKMSFLARKIWRKADDEFFNRLIQSLNGNIISEESEILQLLKMFEE